MWSEASLLPDSGAVRNSPFIIRTLAFTVFFNVGLSALQGLAEAPLPRVPPDFAVGCALARLCSTLGWDKRPFGPFIIGTFGSDLLLPPDGGVYQKLNPSFPSE